MTTTIKDTTENSDCVKSRIKGKIFHSEIEKEYAIEQARKDCGEI